MEVNLERREFIDEVLEVLRDRGTVWPASAARSVGWLSGILLEQSSDWDTAGSVERVPIELSVSVLRRRAAAFFGTRVVTDA